MWPPQPEAKAAQFFLVQWAQKFLTVSIAENGAAANSFNQKIFSWRVEGLEGLVMGPMIVRG